MTDTRFDDAWREDRAHLLGLASRMLGDREAAEDAVQEAFGRLARVELDEIDDVRGWLTVVVRRLCLDRLRAAPQRRESSTGWLLAEENALMPEQPLADPADRITLDDQVQLALAVVLDRLTPAERTAFVLHDVFGFPFDSVAEIVGRTPAACRQFASRARTSIRSGGRATQAAVEDQAHRLVVERFVAACAGGDIGELMELLDPDIAGDAILLGHGPLVHAEGRPAVAQRLLGLFGPGAGRVLVPVPIEDRIGLVAFENDRVIAVIRLDEADGLVCHIESFVRPPLGADS